MYVRKNVKTLEQLSDILRKYFSKEVELEKFSTCLVLKNISGFTGLQIHLIGYLSDSLTIINACRKLQSDMGDYIIAHNTMKPITDTKSLLSFSVVYSFENAKAFNKNIIEDAIKFIKLSKIEGSNYYMVYSYVPEGRK